MRLHKNQRIFFIIIQCTLNFRNDRLGVFVLCCQILWKGILEVELYYIVIFFICSYEYEDYLFLLWSKTSFMSVLWAMKNIVNFDTIN